MLGSRRGCVVVGRAVLIKTQGRPFLFEKIRPTKSPKSDSADGMDCGGFAVDIDEGCGCRRRVPMIGRGRIRCSSTTRSASGTFNATAILSSGWPESRTSRPGRRSRPSWSCPASSPMACSRSWSTARPRPDIYILEIATYPDARVPSQAVRDAVLGLLERNVLPEVLVVFLHEKGNVPAADSIELRSRKGFTTLHLRGGRSSCGRCRPRISLPWGTWVCSLGAAGEVLGLARDDREPLQGADRPRDVVAGSRRSADGGPIPPAVAV